MSIWDILLVAGVSFMGVGAAYLRLPEQKAMVLMLPIPFTLAMLSTGQPIDTTNVLGLMLLFGYAWLVWALHVRMCVGIVPTIVVAAVTYCLSGWLIRRSLIPSTNVFWVATTGVFLLGASAAWLVPDQNEPAHRTTLSVWVKLPAIALVVSLLLLMKGALGGFVTLFPMVGVVVSYEARYSLWSIVRRIPWVILTMIPLMVAIRLTQNNLGLGLALVVGWLTFVPTLVLAMWINPRLWMNES